MPGTLQTVAFFGVFPRRYREAIVALQQWEEKWQTSSRCRNKIKQERERENKIWLRWVHNFIFYCYKKQLKRRIILAHFEGVEIYQSKEGMDVGAQGSWSHVCISRTKEKAPLVFSFSLSSPSGTLAHVVMLPTFLSQGIPETQLRKHLHRHVYCWTSGMP